MRVKKEEKTTSMTLFIDKIQSISVYFFINIRSICSPNSQMQMWPLSHDRHLVSMFSLTAWASRTALSLTALRDVLRGQAPNCILISLMFFRLFSQAQWFFLIVFFIIFSFTIYPLFPLFHLHSLLSTPSHHNIVPVYESFFFFPWSSHHPGLSAFSLWVCLYFAC